jgi:hypothetical protein
MSSLTEFSFFSTLPTELRLKIWPLTFLAPRLIEIRTDDHPSNIGYIPTQHGSKISDVRWVTKCPPLSALSVCRESRSEALKVFTLRFELLASGPEVIYINPLLDTIYANFKWSNFLPMLLDDIRVFDEEGRGVRLLALSMSFFWGNYPALLHGDLPMDRLDGLTLVIEGVQESYWEEWDRDCALAPPVTEEELRLWEESGRRAGGYFYTAMHGRDVSPVFSVLTIRRGDAARGLNEDDRKYYVLEGPMRPHMDHDPLPEGVALWD